MEEILEIIKKIEYKILISSILTIIITEIIKKIIKIKEEEKDTILSKIGLIASVVVYMLVYIIEKRPVQLNQEIIIEIINDIIICITFTKGMYTAIKQMKNKKTVYEKLKYAQETIEELNEQIKIKQEENAKWIIKENIDDSNNK